MKKYIFVFLLTFLFLAEFGGAAVANAAIENNCIVGTISFDTNNINEYSNGCSNAESMVSKNFLLPPGAVVRSVDIYKISATALNRGFFRKEGHYNTLVFSDTDDTFITTSSPYVRWEQGHMRQFNFVKIILLPTILNHSASSTDVVTNVSFKIRFAVEKKVHLVKDTAFDTVASKVFSNFSEASNWYKPLLYTPSESKHYDYLIIVPNKSIIPSLSTFVKFKEEEDHLKVNIVALNDIKLSSEGKTTEEKIRNFLKKHYLEWGLKYLLIVGSYHSVPMCYMYPKLGEKRDENGLSRPIGRTPTDFYYSELDSDWDANGDGLPGEFDEDTKYVKDFYPDLFVGRIPFDKVSKIQKVLDSDISYETNSETFRKDALLVGAMLYYGEEKTSRQDGAMGLNFASQNYLEPAGFNVFSMYEKSGTHSSFFKSNVPISEDNFVKALRTQKYGLVLLNAHGSPQYIARKYWTDSDNNGKVDDGEIKWETLLSTSDINKYIFSPSVFYSASCETAWPEKDNIGNEILLHGGAAYIGASRISYGGGTIDPILEGFVENYALNNYSLGASLDVSLFESPHSSIYDFVNLYDFNLYGDPSLRVNPPVFTNFCFYAKNRFIKIEQGGSVSIPIVLLKNKDFSNDIVFDYDIDIDGIKANFVKTDNGVVIKIHCSSDSPPGNFVLKVSGTDSGDKSKVTSIPIELIIEEKTFSKFDLNKDGKIDGEDLVIFAAAFGSKKGDANFDPNCDFNEDGVINGADLTLFAKNFGNN